jgi:transposase
MAWTAEDRRTYAPAIQEMVRQGMIVRLARTIEAIDPQPGIGRPRVWSSLIMLQALGHLARDSCAWRRLPRAFPPRTTVWSRLDRWRKLKVLERALAVVVACHRLARGRARRPTAGTVDTQSVKTTEKGVLAATMPARRFHGVDDGCRGIACGRHPADMEATEVLQHRPPRNPTRAVGVWRARVRGQEGHNRGAGLGRAVLPNMRRRRLGVAAVRHFGSIRSRLLDGPPCAGRDP